MKPTADTLLGAALIAALWLWQAPAGALVVAGVVVGLLVARRTARNYQQRGEQ